MDKEINQFQKDLLDSARQMKSGKAIRKTEVKLSTAHPVLPVPCSKSLRKIQKS